ncbi:hypothetical protein, partial [Luteimonas sp. J16]
HLRQLEAAIDEYARREGRLPPALETLGDETGRRLSLVDPLGTTPYQYEPGEGRRYRLCAVFATDTRDGTTSLRQDEGWRHPAGRHCFQRMAPEAARPEASVD